MFGLVGKLVAQPGKRDDVLAILRASVQGGGPMPGCRLYVTGRSSDEPDVIVVTEVWDDEAAHAASLQLPAVRDAIRRAMPLLEMTRMEQTRFEVVAGIEPGSGPVTDE